MALESHLIDKDASVGLQARESHHEVLVEALDFADSARVLKLRNRVLFNGQDDAVLTTDCNGGTAAIDSLEGVLHLEELAIGGEDRVCLIVSWHAFV